MAGLTAPLRATNALLFHNARLICPKNGRDERGGLLVENGTIADIGSHLTARSGGNAAVADCGGQVLCPGLIDAQVFTGEPGEEHRETLESASRAAAAGGITSLLCMPNTEPVIDDVALVHYMRQSALARAVIRIYPAAAMTKGLEGREMSEFGLLKEAGAIAFSNGKKSVANSQVMRLLMAYAKDFDALLIHHTEDRDLSEGGVMNEGETSSRLGLQGIPAAAEAIVIERDLRLVELTGAKYHAAAVSAALSLAPVRAAKANGLRVTCGVPIANLTLNEFDIGDYNTSFKLKPPLRTEDDRRALVEGLRDGVIDVIVSNHDPQDADLKRRPFDEAADGAAGLETLFAAALQLYHSGELDLLTLLKALTSGPAALLGLPGGRLERGAPADLVCIDLDRPWRVDRARLLSRSKNYPFAGRVLQGTVLQTYVAGKRVYEHPLHKAG